MACYIVTGGAGFIGSHISTALVARGDSVRVVDDLSSGKLENLSHLQVGPLGSGASVEFVQASVTDAEAVRKAFEVPLETEETPRGVFHEAAQVSVPQSVAEPERSYAVNVMGTLNVLEACKQHGVKRCVFAASAAAYGASEEVPKCETMPTDPCSPYASGKLAGEELLRVWARLADMHTVALRYFNVFGPRQADDSPYTGVIAIFARRLIDKKPITIFGDGEQTRDFVFIDNVVSANLLAMDADAASGKVMNIGTGVRVSLHQLYEAMCEYLGSDQKPSYGEARTGDVRHSLASIDRAQTLLEYEPQVHWKVGLGRTLDWYKQGSGTG